MRVLVIGAGVGGLAVANGLADRGHEVRVFEHAPALREGGAGLTVWSNGTAALDRLGISLEDIGRELRSLRSLTETGRLLWEADLDEVTERLGSPTIEVPRRLLIVRKGYRDPSRPVGTGPFRFRSFHAGRVFAARRFDDHWDGAPYVDEVRIVSAETEARGNAVQAGEVEYAHEMTPTFTRLVRGNPRVRIVATPRSGAVGFVLKTDRPPFDDPDAALAMKLLADRRRLVEVVLAGRGELGNDMYGRGYRYYPAGVAQRERDVAEARRLLRKSGALNTPVTLYTSTAADGFVDAAHLYARQAGEAGLRVRVTTGPPETYFTDLLDRGTIGSHRCGAMPIPTYISERLLSGAPQNVTAWGRKDFDASFTRAQSMVGEQERAPAYGRLLRTVRDSGGLVLWGHSDWLNAVSSRLHGVAAAPPNTVDWARFDTCWLA